MNEMTNVIVSFLFLPVTVFIIIPLLMFCGWLLFKLIMQLKMRLTLPKPKKKLANGLIQTERRWQNSREIY